MARWRLNWEVRSKQDLVAAGRYAATRIIDESEQQLSLQPNVRTKHRKPIGQEIPFEHQPPIWQLAVAEYRVFYNFDEREHTVHVWAVVYKGTMTTKEALRK